MRLKIVLFSLLLSSCASAVVEEPVVVDSFQDISIRTPGVTGAHCFVAFADVSIPLETPTRIRIPRGQENLDISCFKGPHVFGRAVVPARYAQSETDAAECLSCSYPEDIIISMNLRAESLR